MTSIKRDPTKDKHAPIAIRSPPRIESLFSSAASCEDH
jgi:hypothetical protein